MNYTEITVTDDKTQEGTMQFVGEVEDVQPKTNYYQIALFMGVIILTQFASKFVPA